MHGRDSDGVVCILGNADPPDKATELNDWVINVHYQEIADGGLFVNATRFRNPKGEGGAASPRFLTVYETQRIDPAPAWRESVARNAARRTRGEITPISPYSATTMIGAFRRVRSHKRPAEDTTGLLVVMLDCSSDAVWSDFEAWYDDVHIPDILGTGLYHAATRYESDGLETGQPRFLTIYETGGADPVSALDDFTGRLKTLRPAPRKFDTKVRFWAPFVRIGSLTTPGVSRG